MKNRDIYYEKDFIFAKKVCHQGYPILFRIVETRMKRLLKLGLSAVLTPHSLRNTHTSLFAEAGVNLDNHG